MTAYKRRAFGLYRVTRADGAAFVLPALSERDALAAFRLVSGYDGDAAAEKVRDMDLSEVAI